MNPLILIPARLQATRLPGKPLADIGGVPMIVHVWRRAIESGIGRVAVATDDDGIRRAVEAVGATAVMTRADHPSGSDRIFEALSTLDPGGTHDVIVNLQGDLPTLDPALVRTVTEPLADAAVDIATLAAVITAEHERTDANVVKVVGTPIGGGNVSGRHASGAYLNGNTVALRGDKFATGLAESPETPRAGETEKLGIGDKSPQIAVNASINGSSNRLRALYFTRATAPFGDGPLYHHIGIYAYRRTGLERFIALPPSTLERREKLEQLRALEAGMRIDVSLVETVPLGVDTPADLERARALLSG